MVRRPSAGPATPPPNQVATGPLKFANWPAYIDQATEADQETGVLPAGSSKTLVDFTAKHGVEVDYEEKIGDNSAFVADDHAGPRRRAWRPAGTSWS